MPLQIKANPPTQSAAKRDIVLINPLSGCWFHLRIMERILDSRSDVDTKHEQLWKRIFESLVARMESYSAWGDSEEAEYVAIKCLELMNEIEPRLPSQTSSSLLKNLDSNYTTTLSWSPFADGLVRRLMLFVRQTNLIWRVQRIARARGILSFSPSATTLPILHNAPAIWPQAVVTPANTPFTQTTITPFATPFASGFNTHPLSHPSFSSAAFHPQPNLSPPVIFGITTPMTPWIGASQQVLPTEHYPTPSNSTRTTPNVRPYDSPLTTMNIPTSTQLHDYQDRGASSTRIELNESEHERSKSIRQICEYQ